MVEHHNGLFLNIKLESTYDGLWHFPHSLFERMPNIDSASLIIFGGSNMNFTYIIFEKYLRKFEFAPIRGEDIVLSSKYLSIAQK